MSTRLQEIVITLFAEFCDMLREKYFYGMLGSGFYGSYRPGPGEPFGVNQYIQTTADLKVKLGGFLEERLLGNGLTVHSELRGIYGYECGGPDARPDLTIHEITNSPDGAWTRSETIAGSLRAVIEVKNNNIARPDCIFYGDDDVGHDIWKLATLDDPIIKALVILDEGIFITPEALRVYEKTITENHILVLSNNERLNLFPHSERPT